MTAYKFKGWENIDTSEVTTSEVEASYLAVQSKIREIENAYGQKTAAVKRRNTAKFIPGLRHTVICCCGM